jgi:hypothetical protein
MTIAAESPTRIASTPERATSRADHASYAVTIEILRFSALKRAKSPTVCISFSTIWMICAMASRRWTRKTSSGEWDSGEGKQEVYRNKNGRPPRGRPAAGAGIRCGQKV